MKTPPQTGNVETVEYWRARYFQRKQEYDVLREQLKLVEALGDKWRAKSAEPLNLHDPYCAVYAECLRKRAEELSAVLKGSKS